MEHHNYTRGDCVMMKKEMIAMLLAGGQGSRLGVLTAKSSKTSSRFWWEISYY